MIFEAKTDVESFLSEPTNAHSQNPTNNLFMSGEFEECSTIYDNNNIKGNDHYNSFHIFLIAKDSEFILFQNKAFGLPNDVRRFVKA